jgi:hypothetical protein
MQREKIRQQDRVEKPRDNHREIDTESKKKTPEI